MMLSGRLTRARFSSASTISWRVGSARSPHGAGQWGATRPCSASSRADGLGWVPNHCRIEVRLGSSSAGSAKSIRASVGCSESDDWRGIRPPGRMGSREDRPGRRSGDEERIVSKWNYGDVWETVADSLPDAPALTHGAGALTWSEMDRRADNLARWLLGTGVEYQDKVALYLYNCPEYLE